MFSALLSLVFPPTPHEERIANTQTLTPHPQCIHTHAGTPVYTCARYDTPDVHASLLSIKSHQHRHAQTLLAQLLADTLLEDIADDILWNTQPAVIVPMPLSREKERARGFNQVAYICETLPHSLKQRVRTDILMRVLDTPPQKTLSKRDRLTALTHAFDATLPLTDTHVILIDDITTTGATLKSAARALEHAGARVTCYALARA